MCLWWGAFSSLSPLKTPGDLPTSSPKHAFSLCFCYGFLLGAELLNFDICTWKVYGALCILRNPHHTPNQNNSSSFLVAEVLRFLLFSTLVKNRFWGNFLLASVEVVVADFSPHPSYISIYRQDPFHSERPKWFFHDSKEDNFFPVISVTFTETQFAI